MKATMYVTPEKHNYIIELDAVECFDLTQVIFDLKFDDECDPDELVMRKIFSKLTTALTNPRVVVCDGYFHRPIHNSIEEPPRVLDHVDIKEVSVVLEPADPRAILFSVKTVGVETNKCWSLRQSLFGPEHLRRCHLTKGHSCLHSNGESWWP